MGSYPYFLVLIGLIHLTQGALTPIEIATAKKHGLAEGKIMSADTISFDEFISKFNRKYENKEEVQKRKNIFQNNVNEIIKHNKLYETGKSSYMMGVNELSDMTIDELVNNPTGCDESNVTRGYMRSTGTYQPIDLGKEPSSMDWREQGVVNTPRNQGRAKTCWAFSATGSIESAIAITYGNLQDLSEQYLIDCTGKSGCASGNKNSAIDYVINNGMALESGYPYTPGTYNPTCKLKPPKSNYSITSNRSIRNGKDDELLNALVHIGPVSVGIFVSSNFPRYRSAIFEDSQCTDNSKSNHAVLLVGYGIENGTKYWLLRNSWGTGWGEQGYIKLSRNKTNHCRISSTAVVPSGSERFLGSTMFLICATFSSILINQISVN